MNRPLIEAAERIQDKVFLGGPLKIFESAGRNQFILLLKYGLNPHSKVLDIGCGCLRGGYWLIRFLDPGRYFGIEPNMDMLEAGKQEILGDEILNTKKPRFDSNDQFDYAVFGESNFDFFLCGSIWTHAPKIQIQAMLERFSEFRSDGAVFLTSYIRTEHEKDDYMGNKWVGRSHASDQPGLIKHRLESIKEMAGEHSLTVRPLAPRIFG
ncbi:MAG: class I SAM-dependent methyltransferase [Verrucomicrobiae bacterium]|nr:class I SAM-dependent methyltransferase [Verrucomicrobiae bacterium]